ncbi:hypothetical protein HHK36_006835 [Tetracentron sinense]|uniref:Uncharacterized protein n=1 Tax=Tetracentron sinense TaxID=13715 RepID=A0A834ZLD3_TETSI|nr:hypothetical protein HHK36_006835 [Tetracentron sinense]
MFAHLYDDVDPSSSYTTSDAQVLWMMNHALEEETDPVDRHGQQEFLGSADYLSNYGMTRLIPDMQAAATEVLKGKQLRDLFNTSILHETIVQILNMFTTMGSPHHWVNYLVPENAMLYKHQRAMSNISLCPDFSKLDQLMAETRAVLSSDDFGSVVEISLRTMVDAVMEDIGVQPGGGSLSSGMPLAKLLPRIAQTSPLLLEQPSRNRFIQIIQSLPEVELFFTLLYANISP